MMENQNRWKDFFSSKKSVLLLLLVAIVSSTLYAIYLKQKHCLDVSYIGQYWGASGSWDGLDVEKGMQVYWIYLKKYLIVWLFGTVSFLWPMVIGITFFDIFAYGFSVTALYLNYGKSGILIAGKLFMIQGIILTVLLLELLDYIIKKNQVFHSITIRSYMLYLVLGGIGCGIIALNEVLINAIL